MDLFKRFILFWACIFFWNCGGNIIEEPKPLFSSPLITEVNGSVVGGNPKVKIEWYFPVFEEPIIKGFKLERAENNGEFSAVQTEILPNQRSIELPESFRNGKVSFRISTISDRNPQISLSESYFAPNIPVANACVGLSATVFQVADKPSVFLNWSLNPNSAAYRGSFQILKGNPTSPTLLLLATNSSLNFVDDKVEFDKTYVYSVRLGTTNCPSNTIPLTVVRKPIGLCPNDFSVKIITENTKKFVILSWDAQLSSYSSFTVKRANVLNGDYFTLKENIQSTVFKDTEVLKPNTTYYYKIVGNINSQPPNSCETADFEVKF